MKRLRKSIVSDDDDDDSLLLSNSPTNNDTNEIKREQYRSFLYALQSQKQAELEDIQRIIESIRSELASNTHDDAYFVPTNDVHSRQPKLVVDRKSKLYDLYGQCVRDNRSFKQLFDRLSVPYCMRVINSVSFGDALATNNNVVSSVEYNAHKQMFAVSGSVKQIRIYDYQTFTHPLPSFNGGGGRFVLPLLQITTPCKVASVCWEPGATADVIAAADYEGSVKLYNIHSEAVVNHLDEHERRVWSVDFSKTNSNELVSGSDDGRVKHWSVKDQMSTFTLDVKANVCSVQFHCDGVLFAFGAADHHIYVHDVRSPFKCLHTLKDHKKAVSYVRWLDRHTLLSASTDNTIKQWREQECVKTHRGHLHEKNFVGLSVFGDDWFACGSETNKLHVYSRHLEHPLCDLTLSGRDPLTGEPVDMEGFASSVSWVNEQELLAGNSLGMVTAVHISKEL